MIDFNLLNQINDGTDPVMDKIAKELAASKV